MILETKAVSSLHRDNGASFISLRSTLRLDHRTRKDGKRQGEPRCRIQELLPKVHGFTLFESAE